MDDQGYRHEHAEHHAVPMGRFARIKRGVWATTLHLFDRAIDAGEYDLAIIRREADLFIGIVLFLIGILGFHSGRYCDGNTADYLSCTRPVTYYYYSWIEMIVIVLGVSFVLFWYFKREYAKK